MSFQILACGSNGSYQLGLGNDEDYNTLQHVTIPNEFRLMVPKMLAFGGNHTLLLYPDGQLLATGDNEFGQCGVESANEKIEVFTKVPGRWKQVAAGWQFSILCSMDDVLYSCGHGPKGELGLGKDKNVSRQLSKIDISEAFGVCDALPNVVSIKCSINHTVVKFENGNFVGWGVCRKGQLGPQAPVVLAAGKEKPMPAIWNPSILPFQGDLSFCLGTNRTILWDQTSIKILGSDAQDIKVQARVVESMWSSIHYSTEKHKGSHIIQSTGNNLHGQIFKYEAPGPIQEFTVGSEHGLVLLADNSVYAWGWGEHGNCGIMRDENVTFDYLNKVYDGTEKVVKFAGGLATTWVVVRVQERRRLEGFT